MRRTIPLLLIGSIPLLLPLAIKSPYQVHLLIMAGINILLALSFSLLFSAGLITIGAAGFWAIGAYSSAVLVMKGNLSFWISLPLAGVASGIVALITGLIILRSPGVAFIVQTMVINMVVEQVLGQVEFLGGWAGILGIPNPGPIGSIRFVNKVSYYYLILFLLFMITVAVYGLYSSRIGKAWRAIKLNPHLAETLGIDLFRYRLLAFVIASGIAGIAGSFYAHYFRSLEPGMFSVFKSIYIQIYSILGGLNFYILGPILGSLIMTLLPEFLRVSKEIEPILTGAVLIGLVIFLPGGILSLPERLKSLWQKKFFPQVAQKCPDARLPKS
jgi:branched-chain amino acid transport system permease protein